MKDFSGKYVKHGDLYIKYGNDGLPDYGFLVKGTSIAKFINLRNDREPEEIILPPIITEKLEDFTDTQEFINNLKNEANLDIETKYRIMRYIDGYVVVDEGCFEGLNNKKIIINTEYPIRFDELAFNRNIKLVIPKEQSVYQIIDSRYSERYGYSTENDGLLIARKNFPFSSFGVKKDSKYYIHEQDKEASIGGGYLTLKIEHPSKLEYTKEEK